MLPGVLPAVEVKFSPCTEFRPDTRPCTYRHRVSDNESTEAFSHEGTVGVSTVQMSRVPGQAAHDEGRCGLALGMCATAFSMPETSHKKHSQRSYGRNSSSSLLL